MKTANNTFGVAFYLKKQKATQAGKSPIYARITVNGKRIEISVKRSIEESSWNPVKGMAKGSRQEITKLNQHLDQFKVGVIETYQQLTIQKKLITAELLKDKFTGKDQQDFTICKLIEYHNREESENLHNVTISKGKIVVANHESEWIIRQPLEIEGEPVLTKGNKINKLIYVSPETIFFGVVNWSYNPSNILINDVRTNRLY